MFTFRIVLFQQLEVAEIGAIPEVKEVPQYRDGADGAIDPMSVNIVTSPTHGVVTVDPTTGLLTYTSFDIDFIGLNVSSVTDTLEYTVQDNYGAVSDPATVTINVVPNTQPWQNPRNRLDVNADTFVTPFDILLVLTHIQTFGSELPNTAPPPFVDVDGNNAVTVNDIRLILEVLNVAEGEQPEGEGELAPMISMLSGPIDVSLQHTSFADSSLATNPIVVDVKTAGDEVLPIAAVLEPVQLAAGRA